MILHSKTERIVAAMLAAAAVGCSAAPATEGSEGVCEMGPQPVQSRSWGSNGTHLNSWGSNGTSIQGVRLTGPTDVGSEISAVLGDGRVVSLRIDSSENSADGALVYYRLTREGANVCPDSGRGIFLPGVWDERGARHDERVIGGERVSTTYACESGVLAKCAAWGYAPWTAGVDLHQACTRMARADYCGDGVSYTKDGTAIDVFDAQGLAKPVDDPTFLFEAGWRPEGAACVARARFEMYTAAGEAVLPSCWASLPKCDTWEAASALGASIGNRSRMETRTICR
jgi:hypothetical protein